MRVHQADVQQTGLGRTVPPADAKSPEQSFGVTLAATAAKGPKGEQTRKVDGRDFVEVVAGPRNGMFINKSGNERDGQAFVRKRGAEYDLHIYGTGAKREIIKVQHASAEQEKTHPVDGRPFAEITSGPRNGMYVNTTQNERSGEAFVLVKRADRDLHIYGSGKDRRVIVSWHKDQPGHRSDAKPEGVEPTNKVRHPESGGSAAPTTGT